MNIDHKAIDILSALGQIVSEIHTTEEQDKALGLIARSAVDYLKVSACSIKVLNERRNKLELYSTVGFSDEFLEKIGPFGMFNNPTNRKAIDGETVIIDDFSMCPLEIPDEFKEEGFRSTVCIPLKLNDQVFGVMSVYDRKPHTLDTMEMAFLNNLAVQSAAVIYSLRRFMRMQTLMGVAKTVSSYLDLDRVLDEIVNQAAKAMKVRAASLRLLDESTNTLQFKASYGLTRDYISEIPYSLEQSPVDRSILENKEVIEVFDMNEDSRIIRVPALVDAGFKSMLCAPLIVQDKAIGILKLYTADSTHFNDEDKNFLMAMSELSALAIRNASLYEKLHSSYLVTRSLTSTLELERVMELITIHAADYLNAMGAQVLLWDAEKERFTARSIYKISKEFIRAINMNRAWSALEGIKGNTVIVGNLEEDERIVFKDAAMKEGMKSLLSVPIRHMDRVMGILQVYCRQTRNFTSDEVEFISTLANHGAMSIENAKLHEHFKNKYDELVDDIYIWHDWTSYVMRS